MAGAVCGFIAIVLSISFGSLLLPAGMHESLHVAIAMALFSTAVAAAVSALLSPIRGAVSIMEEIPLVAIAGAVAPIVAGMQGHAAPAAVVATVVAATALATGATGLLLLLLGFFRLGGLVRFVPYPVIGGFLAGTGWVILQGGVNLVAGAPLDIAALGGLVTSAAMLKAGLALAFIAILALLQGRLKSDLILPGASFVAIILFNLAALAGGATSRVLLDTGWLIPLPVGQGLWPPVPFGDLAAIDWREVAGGLVALPGIAAVTVMAILMNATGIEIDSGRDVDLDRELSSVGVQNLVAGLGGGMPAYPAVSLTLLASRLGAPNRAVGLIVAGIAAATLLFGRLVLDIVPAPLLGALLVWIGGELIFTWLILAARRLLLREYLIILVIFVGIVAVGFPFGIVVGLVAAAALFVVEYGRIDAVRLALRGSEYQSNVEGSEERRAALRRLGGAILILRLQGYLFFGTAERLRSRILGEIGLAAPTRVRFVVIDFQRVTGLDSSAALSLRRLVEAAARDGFVLVATGGGKRVRDALRRSGFDLEANGDLLRFEDDFERGLAWCEGELLRGLGPEVQTAEAVSLDALLRRLLDGGAEAQALAACFERLELPAGAALIAEGAPSDDIYFIESGRVAVRIDGGRGSVHVADVGPGAIVGEVAFYTGRARTASVVAEAPLVAWRLSRVRLALLEGEMPKVASRVHRGFAAMLAERLGGTDRLVRFLAD